MRVFVYSLASILLLTGCASFQPVPTPTPAPTFTAISLPTETNVPMETPDAVTGLLPRGLPVNEWNGVPIMPGALKGQSDAEAYRFTTAAGSDEIQTYYQSELAKLGWELLGTGDGEAGAMILIFTAGEETLSISILPSQGISLVMIVK